MVRAPEPLLRERSGIRAGPAGRALRLGGPPLRGWAAPPGFPETGRGAAPLSARLLFPLQLRPARGLPGRQGRIRVLYDESHVPADGGGEEIRFAAREAPLTAHSVLVVGGAGYIGSHMCRRLLDAGHRVTVFDNLSRGHADAVEGCELVRGDIRSAGDLRACLEGRSFDLTMHFAALAYVGESVLKPAEYYDTNVRGSLMLLEALREASVGRLVFSSTCATYGEVQERPITEAHPQHPVNPYGRSKWMVEQVLRDYAATYGFSSVSLRYFNAAGCDPQGRLGERHDPETHLIPLVLREAQRVAAGGDPEATGLSLFGTDLETPDGTCVRDYTHVSDLCEAHLLAAERLLAGTSMGFEAYNLGSGAGCSVLQVIEACRRVTGIDIRYRTAPRRAGDPLWLVGSSDRAREVLGWRPAFTAIDGIVGTAWRWMQAQEAPQPSGAPGHAR
ncbi:MAG: UDP-glucose 4-epimerase GalE [Holophagaceae bacterium]|nr:UDP-glucose 4-epimerase GalE [Holophagaceae bacterium]